MKTGSGENGGSVTNRKWSLQQTAPWEEKERHMDIADVDIVDHLYDWSLGQGERARAALEGTITAFWKACYICIDPTCHKNLCGIPTAQHPLVVVAAENRRQRESVRQT